jgi:hypothetical protein
MDWRQIALAAGTWAIALFTLSLVWGQLSTAKKESKIRLYLDLRKEFDCEPLLSHREKFAGQILDGKEHEELNQGILNFIEDVGMFLRRDCLDREMVWETFGHHAKMWWSACREYIVKEQAHGGDNIVLFENFKRLIEQMYKIDTKRKSKTRAELEPSQAEIRCFLQTEALRPREFVKAA